MRYPASEKAEIISLVEQSHLPAKATLVKLGIPRAHSIAGTTDCQSAPKFNPVSASNFDPFERRVLAAATLTMQ